METVADTSSHEFVGELAAVAHAAAEEQGPDRDESHLARDLDDAYQAFSKPVGTMNLVGGLLILLALGGGITGWIMYTWLAGAAALVLLILAVILMARLGKPHAERASRSILAIQARHGLDSEACLAALRSTVGSGSELKEFVAAAWGEEAAAGLKADGSERGGKPGDAAVFRCGRCDRKISVDVSGKTARCHQCRTTWFIPHSPACGKCDSRNVVGRDELKASTVGGSLGGFLLGAPGMMLGAGFFSKHHWTYECKQCGARNWEVTLGQKADI